ncbi:MAG TPA: hypothetical protein VFT91_00505, partial [Dehalococcoidia bacterium]|nr:hypothetical protein [Dehalococcoidia bacterium]
MRIRLSPLGRSGRPLWALAALAGVGAFLWASPFASADTAAQGNGYYKVFIEDQTGADGIGVYTAATGPSHPVGQGQNVLFGGDLGDATTSWNTIRSYTSGTDYTQTSETVTSGNPVLNMDA